MSEKREVITRRQTFQRRRSAAAFGSGDRSLADPSVDKDGRSKSRPLQFLVAADKIGQVAIDDEAAVGFGADTGRFKTALWAGEETIRGWPLNGLIAVWTSHCIHV